MSAAMVRRVYRDTPAGGSLDGCGGRNPRVSVAFDEATFDRLRALAADRNVSFGEAVRHYVGLGLKTIPQHSDLEA
jgi:hypothetical protein